MEQSTPKKPLPVALIAGIAAAALLAVAAGGWFGLCAWVQDNGQLLPRSEERRVGKECGS